MKILGIDPGLSVTGYGVIDVSQGAPQLLEAGALKSPSHWPLERRLLELKKGLEEVIERNNPDTVAVESLFSSYRHPTSALQMAHARGVFLAVAAEQGLFVSDYPPARVKKSLVGTGRASKMQMQSMIQSLFGLDSPPQPPDVADAIAVALCHATALKKGKPSPRVRPQNLPEPIQKALEEAKSGRATRKSMAAWVDAVVKER